MSDLSLTWVWPVSNPCLTRVWPESDPCLTRVWPESDPCLTWVWPESNPCLTWTKLWRRGCIDCLFYQLHWASFSLIDSMHCTPKDRSQRDDLHVFIHFPREHKNVQLLWFQRNGNLVKATNESKRAKGEKATVAWLASLWFPKCRCITFACIADEVVKLSIDSCPFILKSWLSD